MKPVKVDDARGLMGKSGAVYFKDCKTVGDLWSLLGKLNQAAPLYLTGLEGVGVRVDTPDNGCAVCLDEPGWRHEQDEED